MGKISFIFKDSKVSGYANWLNRVKLMSLDVNWEIRMEVARSFKDIFKHIPDVKVKETLLHEVSCSPYSSSHSSQIYNVLVH